MELKDLERVEELKRELDSADAVLAAFEAAPGPTVHVRAYVERASFGRSCSVDLMPVEKGEAVTAAQRQRAVIVAQLRMLGVTVR